MSAVFGTSQQDGCCFGSAPCTVNILWQTQLQVARWLALGSWASLQRPINMDINKEGWGMEGRRPLGSVPLSETRTQRQKSRSQAGGGGSRVGRNEAPPGSNLRSDAHTG